jgi:hypothetical protein
MMSPPFRADRPDFRAIAEGVDLPAMMEAEGVAVRGGKAFCPFHPNENTPALSVYHRDGRWRFKCHSCQAAGDAVDWRALRRGIDRFEAARELAGGISGAAAARPVRPPAKKATSEPAAYRDPAWQRDVDRLVAEAEGRLWRSAEGRGARRWLNGRGLLDFTIGQLRFGWLDRDGRTPGGVIFSKGLLIPWLAPAGWYSPHGDERPEGPRWAGGNVRRFGADFADPADGRDKYACLSGSTRGFAYPHPELRPGEPAVICEGEPDAAITWQEIGHLVNVLTVGGAKQGPPAEALDALSACPLWLIATDRDHAGVDGAWLWRDLDASRVRRRPAPRGYKDLGKFVEAGGDLRAWLADALQ